MVGKEINIFILSLTIIGCCLALIVYYGIVTLRRRNIVFTKEKENEELRHQQELLKSKQEIQQSLMQALGAEIHDTVGQKLTLAYLQMENALHIDDMVTLKKHISIQNYLIQESLDELRSLSKILISNDLSDFNLIGFLDKELTRLSQSGLCKVNFEKSIPNDYQHTDERTELALARICQEFIQNSLKHSKCTEIDIAVRKSQGVLEVECHDNGIGLKTNSHNDYDVRSGSGLLMIQSRVDSIGGTCSWPEGDGTTLIITVPESIKTHTNET